MFKISIRGEKKAIEVSFQNKGNFFRKKGRKRILKKQVILGILS